MTAVMNPIFFIVSFLFPSLNNKVYSASCSIIQFRIHDSRTFDLAMAIHLDGILFFVSFSISLAQPRGYISLCISDRNSIQNELQLKHCYTGRGHRVSIILHFGPLYLSLPAFLFFCQWPFIWHTFCFTPTPPISTSLDFYNKIHPHISDPQLTPCRFPSLSTSVVLSPELGHLGDLISLPFQEKSWKGNFFPHHVHLLTNSSASSVKVSVNWIQLTAWINKV